MWIVDEQCSVSKKQTLTSIAASLQVETCGEYSTLRSTYLYLCVILKSLIGGFPQYIHEFCNSKLPLIRNYFVVP